MPGGDYSTYPGAPGAADVGRSVAVDTEGEAAVAW